MTISALSRITSRIRARSADSRASYLERIDAAHKQGPQRSRLDCANLAHGFAACGVNDKAVLKSGLQPNLAIVTAYNDMLSAHQPYGVYPNLIKAAAREAGGVAQVAGGVPAMCDGVTQGRAGMELSLFSRDTIALSTAIALSHDMFDAAVLLGVCDKIVPGLLIGALSFGHLPMVWLPAGPMPSGISNAAKNETRQLFAQGKLGQAALLESEAASYHAPGTCTFYGTANSNQMLMEIMGLHLPGASFIPPNTPLRDGLTAHAVGLLTRKVADGSAVPLGRLIDERSVVNGIVGLLATGGSTNHTLHLVAMARAAGIVITWDDFSELSDHIPLLARVYPNGKADVNEFQAAGGMGVLISQLLDAGMLHEDAQSIAEQGTMQAYRSAPALQGNALVWSATGPVSSNAAVLTTVAAPFSANGGLKMLTGNLGRGVIKISAVATQHQKVTAPVKIFHDQADFLDAFKAGALHADLVVVVRFQGPKANGMPELHKLTPALGVLQDLGYKVALVTDGRMSGASGKVPAAIHLSPEALAGGPIGRLRDGDLVALDAVAGTLEVLVDADEFAARPQAVADLSARHAGTGRELFAIFRDRVGSAEVGASIFAET